MIDAHALLPQLRSALTNGILSRWYPLVLDRDHGGYLTNLNADWSPAPEQEKMIVSQARHVWTTSTVAGFSSSAAEYEPMAHHGFRFLRDVMWDAQHGGFYQVRSRGGGASEARGWRDEKRAYGNAFGIYALAAFYRRSHDPEVLALACDAFAWLESHAHDPVHQGYFQFLTREGTPFDAGSSYRSIASDSNEVGFKDQNSSIHILEAFTELYKSWNDPILRTRLLSLLELIRDRMVMQRGYLQLFFYPDWRPLNFRDAPAEERTANYGLDHVSFGHDCETAFLMLEASHALRLADDTETLLRARSMLDHTLAWGWDSTTGGIYDGGYYLEGAGTCTIIRETKNWWSQAELLNSLLLFSRIFPDDRRYADSFLRQWAYVQRYVLDPVNGDWYEGGIDKEPHCRQGPKSHMWKCTYHTSRALMNCITLLSLDEGGGEDVPFNRRIAEMREFIGHWTGVGEQL